MTDVILVDEHDNPQGVMEKIAAHEKGLCHRAFSVFVLRERNDEYEVLLQKRAAEKYHCGDLWTNTCCSHPRPEESVKAAAERRLVEEMGLHCELNQIGSFHYIAHFDNGLTENEFDHVLISIVDDVIPQLNPEEVSDYKWMSISALNNAISESPEVFTPWLKPALDVLASYF